MEEELNFESGSALYTTENSTITKIIDDDRSGQASWCPQPQITLDPSQNFHFGVDPYSLKAIPTLESMQSQLEFLEGMVINLRKQLNELKEDNKKYPKRKLNKNFDIK